MSALIATLLSQFGFLIPVLVSLLLAFIAKVAPREKLRLILRPFAYIAASAIAYVLLRWLGKKDAVKIEEGVFGTLFFVVKGFFEDIELKMVEILSTAETKIPASKAADIKVAAVKTAIEKLDRTKT